MVNLKKADLTTNEQKGIAVVMLCLSLVLLWVILPPLVVLFKNLLLLALFATPFVIIAIFPQSTWELFKQLSWELTKKIISSNPVWHLYRGHDYMVNKMEELSVHIKNVTSIKKRTEKEVADLINQNNNLERQDAKATSEAEHRIFRSQVGGNQRLIDTLMPKIDMAKVQESEMLKLLEVWRVDTEIMKHDIDGLARQYELMKELNKASLAASAFMRKDSPEMKMFNESMRQTEKSIADYTSNVESFQRDVLPTLTTAASRNSLMEEDGLKVIEQYRLKRLAKAS